MLKRLAVSLLLAIVLISCGPAQPTPAPTQPPVVETAQLPPTSTSFLPAATTVVVPTATMTPTPAPSATATSAPVEYGPENFPANVNPLTGEQVSDPKLLDARPLAVKINIYPRSSNRPAWGLEDAAHVFLYYHNEGMARYHAIYYGKDPEYAGPVRSGRLPDDYLVQAYRSIFVYSGADARIDERILESNYSNRLITGGFDNPICPPTNAVPLCTFEPEGRHNLIAGFETMRAFIESKNINNERQDLTGLRFTAKPPEGGKPGTAVTTRYSLDFYNKYEYDPQAGNYKLFYDKAMDQGQGETFDPFVDRNTDAQVTAENIVQLMIPDQYIPNTKIIEILMLGEGKAYAYRDGQMYEVTWHHPTLDSIFTLTFPDGTVYPLKPGSTWWQVLNPETKVDDQGKGAWHFSYFIKQ